MTTPGVNVEYAVDIGSDYDSFIQITVHMEQVIDGVPATLQITKKIPFQPGEDLSGLSRIEEVLKNHPLSLFRLCESPAEALFYVASLDRIHGLRPQYQIGPYRADFAAPEFMLVVEIDGHEFHKTQSQRMQDYKRERQMQMLGWRIIRFTALEVFQDQCACVDEVVRIIESFNDSG